MEENIIKSQGEIVQDKNQELYLINSLNTNSVDDHVINEHIMFSNTYDYDSNHLEINKKPDFIVSPLNELSRQEISNSPKINIKENTEDINPKEDELIDIEYEEINLSDFKNNEKNEGLKKIFEVIDKGFFHYFEYNKVQFYRKFLENLKKKIVYLEDIFIEDSAHLDGKINYFILNRCLFEIRRKVFNSMTRKQQQIYFKKKSEKFIKYRYYKIKNEIFENLKIFSKKRSIWFKQIQKDIKQSTIWLELLILYLGNVLTPLNYISIIEKSSHF